MRPEASISFLPYQAKSIAIQTLPMMGEDLECPANELIRCGSPATRQGVRACALLHAWGNDGSLLWPETEAILSGGEHAVCILLLHLLVGQLTLLDLVGKS